MKTEKFCNNCGGKGVISNGPNEPAGNKTCPVCRGRGKLDSITETDKNTNKTVLLG